MCTLDRYDGVFVLTLIGPDDHRLTPARLDDIKAALGRIRAGCTPGSVLVTTTEGRFFSNGFDIERARADPSGYEVAAAALASQFELIVADLLSLPMPTIAAVSGHAAAGGIILAMAHDYVLMRRDRGFLYMSELDIGVAITPKLMALVRAKTAPASRRDLLLRPRRLTGADATEMGIVDSVHDGQEGTVAAAMRLAKELSSRKWDGCVYAALRMGAFPEFHEASQLGSDAELRPRL